MKKSFLLTFILAAVMLCAGSLHAANYTVTATTNWTPYESNTIDKIVDGNLSTKFWSNANQTVGKYVMVDMGSVKPLDNIKLYFQSGDKPAGAKLTISDNNSTWTDLVSFTASDIPSASPYLYTYNAAGRSARYVKMEITTVNSNWFQIAEFQLEIPVTVERTVTVAENNAAMGTAYIGTVGTKSVTQSGSIVISATPASADYKFINWTLDGTEVSQLASYTDNSAGNKTYTANFAAKTPYDKMCKPASNGGGNMPYVNAISVTDAVGVVGGTLSYTPAGASNSQKFNSELIDVYPGATFKLNMTLTNMAWGIGALHKVTTSGDTQLYGEYGGTGNGSMATALGADSKIEYSANTAKFPVTIPADAMPGDVIVVRWVVVDGTSAPACPSGNNNVYCDMIFNVVAPPVSKYIMTAISSPLAAGSITINGAASPVEVFEGLKASFLATSNEGYRFVNWTGVGGVEVSSTNPYEVASVSEAVTLTANFVSVPRVTISATSNNTSWGSAAFTHSGSFSNVYEGESVTFTATATSSGDFNNWTDGSGTVVSENATYTIPSVSGDVSLTANFQEKLVPPTGYCNLDKKVNEPCTVTTIDNVHTHSLQGISIKVGGNEVLTQVATATTFNYLQDSKQFNAKQNQEIEITFTNGRWSSKVWIGFDWNRDGDFEYVYDVYPDGRTGGSEDVKTVTVTVPWDAVVGPSRVRFISEGFPCEAQKDTSAPMCGTEGAQTVGYASSVHDFMLNVKSTPRPTYTVSASAAPSIGGEAKVNGSSVPVEISEGNSASLSAAESEGYYFVNWTVDGVEVSKAMSFTSAAITKATSFVANFLPKTQKEITSNETESGNNSYADVKIEKGSGNAPVWTIGSYDITADNLEIKIEEDGTTPQVDLTSGNLSVRNITVTRVVKSGQWALLTLPFDINLNEVTVDGQPAVYGTNIRIQTYDAAYRAANSRENWTVSGWKEKTSGSISANEGFAVSVNANNGAEQNVSFTVRHQAFDGSDKSLTLDRHNSSVNKGADADWNFYGNPTLLNATKGEGYSLYVYNAATNSYEEYSGAESATYPPFTSWFVQSADDFTSMTFRHGSPVGKMLSADNDYSKLILSINGDEDQAKIIVKEGSNNNYQKNEDAMYFAPLNQTLSQLYLIDQNGDRIASSVVPSVYQTVKVAYKAGVSGTQTITLTSQPANSVVTLKDNQTGTQVQLSEGDSYEFTSGAGLNESRFELQTLTDVTGVEDATTDGGNIKVAVSGDQIIILGTVEGDTIKVISANGSELMSVASQDGSTTIMSSAQGLLIIKVGSVAVKIVK